MGFTKMWNANTAARVSRMRLKTRLFLFSRWQRQLDTAGVGRMGLFSSMVI